MGLASGHAAWRYQVNALAGTGVPNGGGRHKESIFESSGLERRDTGEGTGIPKGGRRQEGAEEKGEKGEEGNDEEKERGDEEFGNGDRCCNGERCCNGSRDGKGGGRMEGEGVERGVGDGCEGEKKLRERQGGEEREEVERGEEARGAEEKREGGRGGGRRSGIEVCIFDNRGVGHSSCPSEPTQYTTEVMAADALFLADHLGWTRFHLVGHSMGGMIACKVAAAASHRIISLALISVSGGGFDLLPRLDSRVFSIVYRLLNARTPELRAQVDLDTHFSQEYMEETEAGSGMSRREALHMEYVRELSAPSAMQTPHQEYVRELSAPSAMQTPHQEYVRELSAPSAMQTPHGANGHLNACWTHSLTPHDVDEICSAHIPTAVIHGRDDVIAHISLGERVARSLGRVARFLPLMGAHMVLRERAHEVNACLAVLMEVAERRVPVEEWVESYRDDRLPVPATWQNEIGRSSSQDFTNLFFQFPSQWFQPEMWTLFSRTWMARTQKNKATAHHLGLLKAKLAKLRREILTPSGGKGGGAGEGFDVTKSGDSRVGLVGFPSVGKSTLLNKLTGTFSEVASYEFTTLTCIPGVIRYRGAKIQLLDLPGIIEGAKDGKGRGRQVISTARTCNCIVIVLDAIKPITHKRLIEKELEGFGIRLNKEPPNLTFRRKDKGGISITAACSVTNLDLDTVKAVCSEYRIHNADVHLRYDATVDDLIDVIEGSRVYIPCVYAVNKVDQITLEELEVLDKLPHYCPVSAHLEWNLDGLLEKVWEYLDLVRVYTKPRGANPDYEDPVILSGKSVSVDDFCNRIHKDMSKQFKYALVWGSSAKHKPQRVGKEHELEDEDVVQIVKKV
ncbi:unnamed protein product [Closterium sp. NIES-53]